MANHHANDYQSCVMVKRLYDVLFSDSGKVLNKDLKCLNSKTRKPHYAIANAGYIFQINYFLQHGLYWDYTNHNPAMFVIDELEAIDIDTETDFKVAQSLAQTL